MNYPTINPYAVLIYCDGSMDYNSKNSGGIGIEIVFPEDVGLERIQKSFGQYQGANIERLELEAIIQGMSLLINIFKENQELLKNVNTVIVCTDRLSLNDGEKTSVYRIAEYRRNKWKNYEGKPIKNSDLLDKLDKTRKKLIDCYCSVEIKYLRRKYNNHADSLARQGKKNVIKNKSISQKGIKIGKRKFNDSEIDYDKLIEKEYYVIHVFKKEYVQDQWELNAEFCEGKYKGKKIKIYVYRDVEKKIHRHHFYKIRIKKIYTHHVIIYKTTIEL